MQESTSKLIISRKPNGYYKQGISHCGAFAVKAVLESYGKDDGREPRDYHPTFFGKITGLTLGFDYWPPVLRSFGISAQAHKADNLNPDEKIQLLKNLLSKNNPVMLRIGNGYDASGRYNKIQGKMIAHWITLWGYDDARKIFYVYDPCLSTGKQAMLPIGNTTRTYQDIIRDWHRAVFSLVAGQSVYIQIGQ